MQDKCKQPRRERKQQGEAGGEQREGERVHSAQQPA